LVTGGASGLGEATVRELVKEKYRVAIADRDKERGTALVQELGAENTIFIETDVSKEDSVKAMVSDVVKAFGAIHVVLTSAGVHTGFISILDENASSKLQETFAINVFGTFWTVKYASEVMIKQEPYNDKGERGVIIMVSSISGLEGSAKAVIYSGTKGAINGFTLPMARDLGPFGIRVVSIAPGTIVTAMTHKVVKPEDVVEDAKNTPIRRVGEPEEFAKCVTTLCMNTYLTGEIIRLDGGRRVS